MVNQTDNHLDEGADMVNQTDSHLANQIHQVYLRLEIFKLNISLIMQKCITYYIYRINMDEQYIQSLFLLIIYYINMF